MIRRFAVAIAISICASGLSAQQQSRAELLRSATTAYDDFAPDRALDLLRVALDPALGPADTAWARGVHLLTQILIEGNRAELARTWARWAVRTAPSMPIDTVNFLAGVVAALREARTAAGTRSANDALAQTTWRWSARGSTEPNGRISINRGAMTATVNARVVGGAVIPTGQGLSLPPGTYEIEAAAVGYLPARVTREVLPGVTTMLTLSLTSAAVATAEISESMRQHAFANVVPLTIRRFGMAASCASGAFVGRDGLILTSYKAIRGADSISAELPTSPRVTVAAYDVAADVAVLRIPATRTDSIVLATTFVDGQSLWGIRLADCRTPSDARVRLVEWTNRPTGALQLGDTPAEVPVGTALVDASGRLAGVWTGGASAVAAPSVVALLDQARRSVAQTIAVQEVGRRENHLYGSVAIAANLTGATLGVSPVESWQWETLATSGPAPLTFVGPMGRYRVQASTPAGARSEQFVIIRPGAHERVVVSVRALAAGSDVPSPVVTKRRSKLPWILAGAGGVGLAAALALGGGGGGETPQKGSISISVPVNPP
jgi:hypothetical protein